MASATHRVLGRPQCATTARAQAPVRGCRRFSVQCKAANEPAPARRDVLLAGRDSGQVDAHLPSAAMSMHNKTRFCLAKLHLYIYLDPIRRDQLPTWADCLLCSPPHVATASYAPNAGAAAAAAAVLLPAQPAAAAVSYCCLVVHSCPARWPNCCQR